MSQSHETLSSEDAPDAPGRVPWLCHVGSPANRFRDAGHIVVLEGTTRIRFGRDETSGELASHRDGSTCDVRIPLSWVSGEHAVLELQADRWTLRDLGSRNGVFVDGMVLTGPHALAPGEVVEIGRSFWVLESGPAQLATAPLPSPHATTHPGLRRAIRTLGRLARSDVPVLLQGETGTGKGFLARWIHAQGHASGPLVVADLAAGSIERQLLAGRGEAAVAPLSAAAGGMLLLDDVGELDGPGQTELLSLLLGRAPRVGAAAADSTGVRIVATSVRELGPAVAEGTFRGDLLSRLAGYTVTLPPLRRRRGDLGLLARTLCRDPAGEPVDVSIEAFRAMLRHDWPFNLRQLEHTLAAAAAVAGPSGVTPDVLRRVSWSLDAATTPRRLAAVRHELLSQLSHHAGRIDEVAVSLGCTREDVLRWLERFALEPSGFAPRAS